MLNNQHVYMIHLAHYKCYSIERIKVNEALKKLKEDLKNQEIQEEKMNQKQLVFNIFKNLFIFL